MGRAAWKDRHGREQKGTDMLTFIHNRQSISRKQAMHPEMIAIWDNMSIGVAIVDEHGICRYMNPIQREIDGFSNLPVVGMHITDLYLPNDGMRDIPTMQCLNGEDHVLRKAYWYKTVNNSLFSSVTDFYLLRKNGFKDGVLAFTSWVDCALVTGKSAPRSKPSLAKEQTTYTFDHIIGRDPVLLNAIQDAKNAAKSSVPIMIWGENGTGKEMFAQAIHAESLRRNKPFVAVNCAAIPENLLEGILFGTAKGAYTDATDKPGLFQKAHGGTLLLDEINSMPIGLQSKLLRVLQERKIRRLGSHSEENVDVRIISILNEHPSEAIARGALRNDLYYRLAVVGLCVPPLRERYQDIPLLTSFFLASSENAREGITLSPTVMQLLSSYSWPGNIRELHHIIEGSLVLLGTRTVIRQDCLPRQFRDALQGTNMAMTQPHSQQPGQYSQLPAPAQPDELDVYRNIHHNSVVPLRNKLDAYEALCIRNVLRITGGNVAKAARIMDLTAPGLRYKMNRYDIRKEDY